MSGQREVERKYSSDPGVALPDFSAFGVVHVEHPVQLHAEYWDSADGQLIKAGWSLRRRIGGHDSGWHLKVPDADGIRREFQLPPDSTAVPVEFQARAVEVVGENVSLVPVVVLETERRNTVITDSVTRRPRFIVSQDVVTVASANPPVQWAETEVELDDDEPESTLAEADVVMLAAGFEHASHTSKARKAFELSGF